MSAGRTGRVFLAAVLLADSATRAAEPLDVYTVNYPLAYLSERIGGDAVRVRFPAPADVDPAFWRPAPETVADYQQADLVVLNGAGYARWTRFSSLARRHSVDTTAAVAGRLIAIEDGVTHSHGPTGAHSHRGLAFTTWLDLDLANAQARAVAAAMSRRLPGSAQALERNLAAVTADIAALDAALLAGVARTPGARLVGSHPVYQYLARRYGLAIESVHFEPDIAPDAAAWSSLESLLARHPARVMIWEAEPLPEAAARAADLGLRSIVFDPCANVPAEGDFLSVMRTNVETLLDALAQ